MSRGLEGRRVAIVAAHGGLVSSRDPDDLPAFCATIVEESAEGAHHRVAPEGRTRSA